MTQLLGQPHNGQPLRRASFRAVPELWFDLVLRGYMPHVARVRDLNEKKKHDQ